MRAIRSAVIELLRAAWYVERHRACEADREAVRAAGLDRVNSESRRRGDKPETPKERRDRERRVWGRLETIQELFGDYLQEVHAATLKLRAKVVVARIGKHDIEPQDTSRIFLYQDLVASVEKHKKIFEVDTCVDALAAVFIKHGETVDRAQLRRKFKYLGGGARTPGKTTWVVGKAVGAQEFARRLMGSLSMRPRSVVDAGNLLRTERQLEGSGATPYGHPADLAQEVRTRSLGVGASTSVLREYAVWLLGLGAPASPPAERPPRLPDVPAPPFVLLDTSDGVDWPYDLNSIEGPIDWDYMTTEDQNEPAHTISSPHVGGQRRRSTKKVHRTPTR